MPTNPEPWRILSASDALSRLRAARHHLDECTELENDVYGGLWEAEDRLRALSEDDAALAARLRQVGVLPEIDDAPQTTNGRSH